MQALPSYVSALRVPQYLVVMCREDLPVNPYWRALGFPSPHCWDVDQLFSIAKKLDSTYLEEARRIYWEFYWRRVGRYHHHHPFPKVYICDNEEMTCMEVPLTEKARKWFITYVVISGTMRHIGVARPEREHVYELA